MNHFFYESLSKEKVKNCLEEGLSSQAYYRSGAAKPRLQRRLPKLALMLLEMLGMLVLLVC